MIFDKLIKRMAAINNGLVVSCFNNYLFITKIKTSQLLNHVKVSFKALREEGWYENEEELALGVERKCDEIR